MKQGFSGKPGTLTPLYDKQGRPRYNRGLLWYHIPLFDYRADEHDPFIYTDASGNQYMPDNHFETDGGSIPPACRAIPFANLDPLNFARAYLNHDGAYQYGGLYMRLQGEKQFKFRLMTRRETDGMMPDWLRCDGANWWTRRVICTGLAAGSWTVWDSDKHIDQRLSRIKARIDVYDRAGNMIENNRGKRIYTSSLT